MEEQLTFSEALELLKQGRAMSRKGWNGKNMFIFMLKGGTVPISAIHDDKLREVIKNQMGDDAEYFMGLPTIRMWTADRKLLTGWLASQTDMFAEDWFIFS